jgi:hypothetical protein
LLQLIPSKLRNNIIVNDNNCWIWIGKRDPNGYGYFCDENGSHYVHRFIYELIKGKISEVYPRNILDHIVCNNSPCCNPDHVKISCTGKNGSRWQTEKTHCKRGHPYSGENLIVRKNKRYCRTCEKDYDKRRNGIRNLWR